MGRHREANESVPAALIAQQEGRIGPRRAARLAEQERMAESSFRVSRSAGVRPSRLAAAVAVAAASMFGATAVAADTGQATTTDSSAAKSPKIITALSLTDTQVSPTATASATEAAKVTFSLTVDGSTRKITTTESTLGEALNDADVVLHADDKVSLPLNKPVAEGASVTIVRVTAKAISEETVDAHTSSEVDDPELPKGDRVVETEGVDGVTVNAYDVVLENGTEVSREKTMTVVKSTRVDEVVRVGTKEAAPVATPQSTGSSASVTSDSSSSASASSSEAAAPAAQPVASGDAQSIALSMMAGYGWGGDQFTCLVNLWNRESGWNHLAMNASSGAYGIPQALPGNKMASAGADWQTNPATQISWGLGYIQGRYGTPCGAWAHSESVGWY
ncbi:MAG: G5 domain-containing protein [Ancrocorticia sp.]